MIDLSNALFADGGVIGANPSAIGGTWAWRWVCETRVLVQHSGVITPRQADLPAITNNLTEMLALVRGLQTLPDAWVGTVYSDSQITLGRIFQGWKWKNIPLWLHHDYQQARGRLVNWDQIGFVLLQGHPTRAELAAGVGSRGYPVSEHNVWADKACGERAAEFLREMEPTNAVHS
jgi:ribonuclease HI